MAVPPSISVCTITAGSSLNFFGDDFSISVTVTPLLGTASHLVWTETGQEFAPEAKTFEGAVSGEISFQVPHVDQDGFVDPNMQEIKNWAYKCVVNIKSGSGGPGTTFTKNISPLVGQDVVDLDSVADGVPTTPVLATIPAVLSVNGMTGNVIVEGGEGGGGSTWYTGSGAPSSSLGKVSDFYLRNNGDYYEKTGSTVWTLRGNLTGPAGAGFDPDDYFDETTGDLLLELVPDLPAGQVTSGTFSYDLLPPGATITVHKSSGGAWPTRPTANSSIVVQWIGVAPAPVIGTGGALNGDIWIEDQA